MTELKVQVSTQEIIEAEFYKSLLMIKGYLQESKGDMEIDTEYTAKAVFLRMEKINNALLEDIKNLAASIVLENI